MCDREVEVKSAVLNDSVVRLKGAQSALQAHARTKGVHVVRRALQIQGERARGRRRSQRAGRKLRKVPRKGREQSLTLRPGSLRARGRIHRRIKQSKTKRCRKNH